MNKFLKISLLAALVMVILGVILSMTGRAAGGRTQAEEMFRTGELDIPFVNYPNGWHIGSYYNDYEYSGDYDYENENIVGDSVDFDGSYPIHKADFKDTINFSAAAGTADSLNVDIAGVGFYIKKSPDGNIHLEGVNVKKVQYFLEGGTLYIKALDKYNMEHMDQLSDTATKVFLYLPDTCSFIDVVMEVGAGAAEVSAMDTENITCMVGAGRLTFTDLKAAYTYFELGMGELIVNGGAVENMDFEIGMGSMEYEGSITGDVYGDCGMGSMLMSLEGKKEDHNYEIESSMGSVNIGDISSSGISFERTLDYGADSYFDLTCAMGSIEIYFTNPEG